MDLAQPESMLRQENAAWRGEKLQKCPTGISGLDQITDGGLPRGRATLICGGAGSGKTLFALSFLVHGAQEYGQPGVLMTFEENVEELAADAASLGYNLEKLIAEKKLAVDFVRVERSEIEETGEYDLEALFARLEHAIRSIGATRVVLDTIESLFSGLSNATILRAELRRLFRWLKDKGITAVITGERGEGTLTRQGMEEYVTDAVILLDHRVHDQVSTRRLRVVKYRGSRHGTNEYPFLIDDDGLSVLPVTSLGLSHPAVTERVSTGVAQIDEMLSGQGYFRGSTILLSGSAGTGKSSLAAHFVNAACGRGERCLYFLFEESPDQFTRNMRSIGIDLRPWLETGLLTFHADRPTRFGLETHLAAMYRGVRELKPRVCVVDPITNLLSVGSHSDVRAMLTRMIDFLKMQSITGLFTSLVGRSSEFETTEAGISSLMDTWIALSIGEQAYERHRWFRVLKSRGMAHSHQIRQFELSDDGFRLKDSPPGQRGRPATGVMT
jgi:circadian clock protein KaiC